MEDLKKVLEKASIMLTSSTDDESDCDSIVQQSKQNSNGNFADNELFDIKWSKPFNKKRNGEKRLPTRKPDPNVYNRNALLARENRKKKKIYLETIEKELNVVRRANRTLSKALRRQLEIVERLEKEKQYYKDIAKNRLKVLTPGNDSNFHYIQRAEENFPATSTKEDNVLNVMDITNSRSSSLSDADNLSMLFDSTSDGSVVAPSECSACDFSSFEFFFPEISTDLYDSPDVTLPITSTTWDDIWGDKGYNVDNFTTSNVTLQNGDDMQNLNADHCYARSPIRSKDFSDQESEPSDFIDVEGVCTCNGTICANCIFPTYRTPPAQLLDKIIS